MTFFRPGKGLGVRRPECDWRQGRGMWPKAISVWQEAPGRVEGAVREVVGGGYRPASRG